MADGSLLSRILYGPPKAKSSTEGQYRPGPYLLSDGWLSATAGRFMNFWQLGYNVQPYGEASAMVEACVSAYAQTVAMCPGDHWRKLPNGGRERVEESALTRLLRVPNDYQSVSDFLMQLTRRLYMQGEAFALAIRNGRNEIAELHIMREGQAVVATDGSIFYHLGGNEIVEHRFSFANPIPARDVLHVRLDTPRHPLKGVSPILSTTLDRAMSGAALNQQVSFYLNQARPSFMLETDQQLTVEQTTQLRQLWDAQTKGEGAGGTPILTWGLKAKPVTVSANDSKLADLLKMTDQNVALAFRMPLQILGVGGTPFASTEALMQSWVASGLGFCLNHIEEAFGILFKLKGQPDEYLEFNTKALLRSAWKELIDGLVAGSNGGLMSPDEARDELDLPKVPGGHGAMPRVQQQVVPLSYGTDMKPPEPAAALPAPAEADDETEAEDEDSANDNERAVASFRAAQARAIGA